MGVVKCMAVSGDGRHLALGGEDGSLTVVAVPDMRAEASIRCMGPSRDLAGRCRVLRLGCLESHHKSQVYASPRRATALTRDRSARSGDDALPDAVRDVDFSPAHQNRVVATTCEDGSCVLWEWSTRRRLSTLQLPPGAHKCCSTASVSRKQRMDGGRCWAWQIFAASTCMGQALHHTLLWCKYTKGCSRRASMSGGSLFAQR